MKEILLDAIVCPNCHGKLIFDAEHQQLICPTDRLIYLIKDGIPLLLTEEASPLETETVVKETIIVETVCQTTTDNSHIKCDNTVIIDSQTDKG
ncbi:Trm112 family protein [Orbaceae bacterium ESL0721]|nr:Trm112 family protein [Orbaceae bacterium ESL0721]